MTLAPQHTPATVAEIDMLLVAVRWRWRHAVWEGNEYGIVRAVVEQDKLLEQRTEATRTQSR